MGAIFTEGDSKDGWALSTEGGPSWQCAAYPKEGSIRWDCSHRGFVIRQQNDTPQKFRASLTLCPSPILQVQILVTLQLRLRILDC